MKFLVDNQLPTALARHLAARGEECIHVMDAGLEQASDSEIWRYAADRKMIITKDRPGRERPKARAES